MDLKIKILYWLAMRPFAPPKFKMWVMRYMIDEDDRQMAEARRKGLIP